MKAPPTNKSHDDRQPQPPPEAESSRNLLSSCTAMITGLDLIDKAISYLCLIAPIADFIIHLL